MLKVVLEQRVFTLEEAAQYKQGTFSSMANPGRNYLATAYASDGTVTLEATGLAKAAMAAYQSADLMRTRDNGSLSQFLTKYIARNVRRRRT